jgi:hypothetical protein
MAMANRSACDVIELRLAERELLHGCVDDLQGLSVEVHYCEPTANTALRVDIESEFALGRLTWWSDGSAYCEALRAADEAQLLRSHTAAANSLEASELLRAIARAVHGVAI